MRVGPGERGLLAIAITVSCVTSAAYADERVEQPQRNSLVLAPRIDALSKVLTDPPTPSAHALGLGVHYLFDFPPRVPAWYGVGIDARVLSEQWSDFGALAIGGVAKVTIGHAPPNTLELDAGVIVSGEDSGGYVSGAALISFFYFEIGYSYQYPIGLDDHPWLGRHQLTMRGIIPVLIH